MQLENTAMKKIVEYYWYIFHQDQPGYTREIHSSQELLPRYWALAVCFVPYAEDHPAIPP